MLLLKILFYGIASIPYFLGLYLIYVGMRFKKSARVDQTAFWLNWLAFVWLWAERSKEIAAGLPFFQKDLSETFGVKPDDGRVT